MDSNMVSSIEDMAKEDQKIGVVLLEIYGHGSNADYNSVVEVAVDCALKMYNVLMNVRKPGTGRNHRATMDLMGGLNGNPFWAKHSAFLMPVLYMALQGQADYAILSAEKAAEPNTTVFDDLRAESKVIGLELFTMTALLLGGQEFLSIKSLEIKKKLIPFLTV